MGQKAHPIGQRLGFIKGWDSNWYGGNDYGDKIAEDERIRQYLMTRLKKASVATRIQSRMLTTKLMMWTRSTGHLPRGAQSGATPSVPSGPR